MKITKEITGALTALLKLEIAPDDYAPAVDKQIGDYRRKAKIPGFRPGHIPVGLVKKMYGKAILADEVNKLISDQLAQYIRDNQINILGNPLPNLEKNSAIDFENQDSFEFYFDLGLAPDFTIPVDQDMQIDNYIITIDDGLVDKYIQSTRKQLGKPAVSESDSENATPVDQAEETDPELPAPSVVPVDSETEPVTPEVELAEMNSEFYNKVFPGLDLQTEEDFREQVRKDASMSFTSETNKLLFSQIRNALIKNTELPLPDDFLKRWLLENNEGKYTPENIEKNYEYFAESIKWQLIEHKLIKENDIEVTDDDIRTYIKINMFRQINMPDMDAAMQQRYDSIVDSLMENKEQVSRINDELYNTKMLFYFKSNIIFHPKEVTYDEFIKIASESHQPDHQDDDSHNHLHDHDHDHDHGNDHEHETN